jgi:pimeloyl-ACP methyl ester carboxylesterase
VLGPEHGYLVVHPEDPAARRPDREVILLLHGLGGSSADWTSPQWRGYDFDHLNGPADRHDDGNATPPYDFLPDLSLSDRREVRCWSGILRGLGHTVIHYSQDGPNDVAEVPLKQFEDLVVPYIRESVLRDALVDKRVTVIAHSRGGILVRYYLKRNLADANWIGRVITLCSPHHATDAPNAKREIVDWVLDFRLGPVDPVSDLASDLVLDLVGELSDFLEPGAGQAQLLPGNELFDRLAVPADTPDITFGTYGGSSVTMTGIYYWIWAPGSFVPIPRFDLPPWEFNWTKLPIEIPFLSPVFDSIPDDAVFDEQIPGLGDIAVTVTSSRLEGADHRTLSMNHAEALFDERIFAAVADDLGTPLDSTVAIGCTEGFVGNRRTKQLHDFAGRTRQCQVDEIVSRAFFEDVQVALDEGYDGCFYCMRQFDHARP